MATAVVDRKTAVRNIVAVLRSADHADWAYGSAWYLRAHHEAVAMSVDHGVTVEQAAGIIAVLSPQVEWTRNLAKAREVCATGTTTGVLGANVAKAERIYKGEPVADVLGGNKVKAFFANIIDPLFSSEVTVDRHAFDIIHGAVQGDNVRALERKGVYAECASYYVEAARALGLTPWQVQAVTWEAWRRQKTYDRPQHTALYQKGN